MLNWYYIQASHLRRTTRNIKLKKLKKSVDEDMTFWYNILVSRKSNNDAKQLYIVWRGIEVVITRRS
jgi:hypothetical protein